MSELQYNINRFEKTFEKPFDEPMILRSSRANNLATADPTFFQGLTSGLKYNWLPVTNRTLEFFSFLDEEVDSEFDFRQNLSEGMDYIYAEELSRAKNQEHYEYILNDIKSVERNREIYDRAGLGGTIVAGVLDPLNIAFFHPVFNTAVRAAWAAKSAFGVAKESAKVGALFGIGSELIRAPFDPLSTPQEVTTNVLGSTIFSGAFGGGLRGVANISPKFINKIKPKNDIYKGEKEVELIKQKQEEFINDIDNGINPRTKKPSGLAEMAADKFNIVHRFIPARRIQQFLYGGKPVSPEVRELHARLAYNAATPLKENYFGAGVEGGSVDMAQTIYQGMGLQVEQQWRKLYNKSLFGGEGTGQIGGIDYRTTQIKYEKLFKNKNITYFNHAKQKDFQFPTPEEYFNEIIELSVNLGNPSWSKKYGKAILEDKKNAVQVLENFLRDIDQRGQDSGAFIDKTIIKSNIDNKLKIELDRLQNKFDVEKDPVFKEVLKLNLNNLKKKISFYEEYNPSRKNYRFPVIYNKEKIIEGGAVVQNKLARIFADHYLEQGFYTAFNSISNKIEKVFISKNAVGRAKAIKQGHINVHTIIDQGDDGYAFGKGIGKGKHLLMRLTNIPEWKVKDYLILEAEVLTDYAKKMGFRIEWARRFGDEDLGSTLEFIERKQKEAGHSAKEIAEIKADYLADFERISGQIYRNPTRADTVFARSIKRVAGMTYLTGAGISSLTETVAMPMFEHGFGAVFRSAVKALDGNWKHMVANARQIQHMNEGLEMQRRGAQNKYLHDNLRPLDAGRIEKTLEGMENFFYKANLLAPITSIGKMIDSAIRIPKFYDQLKNYGNDQFDIIELARYGITDKKIVDDILTKGKWEFSESGMPLLNIDNWDIDTAASRKLKNIVTTYFTTAARNTIIHATAFDRPTIMDGFVYKPWRPYMRNMGIEPDARASVGLKKDGTYEYPMARLESGVMAWPFQFYNFAFATMPRIVGALQDPAKKHRLTGAIALMGMSYVTLSLKKPDWWFENKDYPELFMRVIDHSGITGVYSDIFYHGLNVAIASGVHDPDTSWLKGRYKASGWDSAFGFAGASPGLIREWVLGADELLSDQTDEGLKRLSYNLPYLSLLSLDDDLRALGQEKERFRY